VRSFRVITQPSSVESSACRRVVDLISFTCGWLTSLPRIVRSREIRTSPYSTRKFLFFARAKKRNQKKARPQWGKHSLRSSALGRREARVPPCSPRFGAALLAAPLRAFAQSLRRPKRAIGRPERQTHLDLKLRWFSVGPPRASRASERKSGGFARRCRARARAVRLLRAGEFGSRPIFVRSAGNPRRFLRGRSDGGVLSFGDFSLDRQRKATCRGSTTHKYKLHTSTTAQSANRPKTLDPGFRGDDALFVVNHPQVLIHTSTSAPTNANKISDE
jgi:hypothetical protein